MLELMMSRAIPAPGGADLPAGARFRPFGPGDRPCWHEIQSSSGLYGRLPVDLFDREFGDSATDHVERITFAEVEGETVGVSSGWYPGAGVPDTMGRVHWVAVSLSHQRRRLGELLPAILQGSYPPKPINCGV